MESFKIALMSLQPNILLLFQALGMARLWPGSFQATQIAVDLQRMPICTSLEYSPTIRYNDLVLAYLVNFINR